MLSVGHDEYWSWGMRDAVDAFVERGGNRGNIFRQHRLLAGALRRRRPNHDLPQIRGARARSGNGYGSAALADQHMVRSADRPAREPDDGPQLLPRRLCPLRPRRAAEHRRLYVWRPEHWAFAGTDLRYGDALGLGSYIVAYEVDGCDLKLEHGLPSPTGTDGTPTDMAVLASAPARLISNTPRENE